MNIYSRCVDCGGLLHATCDRHGTYNTAHPGCTTKLTTAQRLALEWRDAIETFDETTAVALQQRIDELDDQPPRLLDAALAYAEWEWPVLPLKAHSKRPATRHGVKDATTDTTRIHTWWKAHPDHNIGIATGHKFDVIDIDVPHGVAAFHHLLTDGELPDCHGMAATASGGIHWLTEPTGDGNAAAVAPGVDYRGAGGYIVAAPSTLGAPGRAWAWTVKPSPRITGDVGA